LAVRAIPASIWEVVGTWLERIDMPRWPYQTSKKDGRISDMRSHVDNYVATLQEALERCHCLEFSFSAEKPIALMPE
jgi:hypothetical protein